MNLTFDILNSAWNKLKIGSSPKLKSEIPGLINPQQIIVKRISEDTQYITVSFIGFDKAVADLNRDIPLIKRAILDWIQKFTSVQIERGDNNSFIIRVSKTLRSNRVAETINIPIVNTKYNNKELVQISNVRIVEGD